MSQEKLSNSHYQSEIHKHSWNNVARLQPQPPKDPQTNCNTATNVSNPSVTDSNEASNKGESNNK